MTENKGFSSGTILTIKIKDFL